MERSVDETSPHRPHHAHVEDGGPQCGEAAVAEKEHLNEQDGGHHQQPLAGPRSTAANTPPRKYPEVPPAMGKFNIWAAKMNAAVTPMRGMVCSSPSLAERLAAIPMAAADTAPNEIQVFASREPSGMCTSP